LLIIRRGAIISISDFFNKELVLYAIAANARAIPLVLDGLTLAKRKVLYSGLLRKPSMDGRHEGMGDGGIC
jgi:DNA gyrase/topoisomerase IV subunit A